MTGPREEDGETKIVVLHRYPEYTDDCMKILNEQWPRSKSLRLRSLHSSCDQFPTSLALLRCDLKGSTEVIGHARINILPQEQTAAWVESVIVRQDLRRKGYGRILMTKTEDHVRACGFNTLYLSTHDQQVFYGRLGYEFCAPVCIYGGTVNRHLLPKQFVTSLIPQSKENTNPSSGSCVQKVTDLCRELSVKCIETEKKDFPSKNNSHESGKTVDTPAVSPTLPTPPPPPPPPSKTKKCDIQKLDFKTMSKMYMKKDLI